MYDEIIDTYFNYWINEHIYRKKLESDDCYINSCNSIKDINKILEYSLMDEKKRKILIELNDLFNSIIEIERELGYKFGFKAGAKFTIDLLEE